MRVLLTAICVLLAAAPGWAGAALAQLAPFTHYTTESEPRALPSAEVHAVQQDQLGFIWAVVYSSGLVRYDGVRMELFALDDGLRSLALWDVAEDATGHLWASSNEGLVVSDKPLQDYGPGERVRFTSTWGDVELLDIAVRRNVMAAAPDGTLWVGTDALGIVRYKFDRGRLSSDTLSVAATGVTGREGGEPAIRAILSRGDGSMWIGLSGGPLVRFADDDVGARVTGRGEPESTVFALYEDREGTLWGGDLGGRFWRLRKDGDVYSFHTVTEVLNSTIHSIGATTDERLLVSSDGGGMLVLDQDGTGRLRHITRQNGLISDVIHQLSVDFEGNVWIAQSGGLSKLRQNFAAFRSFTARSQVGERPLLPAPSISAVQPVDEGSPCRLWAATTGSGVACLHIESRGGSTYVTSDDGLASDWVNALLLDHEGRVWIGTSRGLDVVAAAGVPLPRGGGVRALSIDGRAHRMASFPTSTILSAALLEIPEVDGSDRLVPSAWFAGARSVYALVDGEWFGVGEAAGLAPTIIHAVSVDAGGYVWIGTRDQGLYRSRTPITAALLQELAGDAIAAGEGSSLERHVSGSLFERVWSSATEAPTDQIEALLWHGTTMWAATPVGLFALRYATEEGAVRVLQHLDQRSGLGAAQVYSLAASPLSGTLWVGTNGGISEVDPEARSVLRTVTRRHGLIDNEVWYYGSVRIDGQGRVYFGTAQGLSIYDPRLDRPAPEIERIHLRRADFIQHRGSHNEAAFEYAAASFASEGSVLYRTRLRGYESEWSSPSPEAKIRYTNLPAVFRPRPYTFEVIASNVQGVWTPEPLRHTFYVDPPWWLQWWMFVGYAGLLAGGLVAAHRLQSRRLVKQMRARSQLREAEHRAERAAAEQEAAEARARALQAENERKEAELTKARELEEAYEELKNTQTQLIQAEKMASLGQLTAGIAHEIKNPLNFVNNFSRASIELLVELREELQTLPAGERVETFEQIVSDLFTMAEKVAQHGDRADRIVKSMLQHSRGGSGTFQDEHFNHFVEEYVNLSYHGMRAQHSDFSVELEREYDESAGVVQVISQDLSRVIINLLNNAFYAVHQRRQSEGADYQPRVIVRTSWDGVVARLEVEDNGTGIPERALSRIFEPFFSTKPPGEGTGLGLSLSYDIITQMHRGRLSVTTEEGEGTTFTIELPIRAPVRVDRAAAAVER